MVPVRTICRRTRYLVCRWLVRSAIFAATIAFCRALSYRRLAFGLPSVQKPRPFSSKTTASSGWFAYQRRGLASTRTMSTTGDDLPSTSASQIKLVDIGANLLDDRFTAGIYFGKQRHEPDLQCVLERAHQAGVTHVIVTTGTLQESRRALELVRSQRQRQHQQEEDRSSDSKAPIPHLSCTVGVHPTRCQQEFVESEKEDEQVLQELLAIAQDGMSDQSVVAIGEIGLDYDRLEFCPQDVQQRYLKRQLEVLAEATNLPLFLHNRSVGSDLYDILQQHKDSIAAGGVIHSFDDSLELATKFIGDLDLYIGLNGCSLKTDDNLDVVANLPSDRILLETDSPYCEIRKTHASYKHIEGKTDLIPSFETKPEKKFEMGKCVKNRQEPCHLPTVAQAVAVIKGLTLQELAGATHQNSMKLYRFES